MATLQNALVLLALAAAALPRPGVAHTVKTPALAKLDLPVETMMSSPELIVQYGFPAETHEVSTADGYVLTMHRIPGSPRPANGVRAHRTPVLIGHGMGSEDDQWVVRQEASLAFLLADNGYDVWLANYRGSFYSQKHPKYSIRSNAFWDFSWHENGVLDQPAMVDYILAKTGRPALLMIGHSMSSTAQVVFLAERPEYAGKVLAGVYMAPPVYFRHPVGLLELLRAILKNYPVITDAYSRRVINDKVPFADHTVFRLCHPHSKTGKMRSLCRMILDMMGGASSEPEDGGMLLRMLGHFPSSVSIRQAMHYMQCVASAEFRQYDFGPEKNQALYGSPHPPPYNVTSIATPAYVYYSTTDNLVSPLDAQDFSEDLPGLKVSHKIKSRSFGHFDYTLASNVSDTLYKYILENLNRHI